MKILSLTSCFLLVLVTSCVFTKKIVYDFNSTSVVDSVEFTLKKYEQLHRTPYQKAKWFVIIRENADSFDLIIDEKFGDKVSPIVKIIENSNRYLSIGNNLKMPVVFETDILSTYMRNSNVGAINWGGYYFKIIKDNDNYKVIETGVLF